VAQKEKFEDLVNRVDLEARQFTSFDEYLAAKDAGESEWQKPVSGVEENSSSNSNEKGDATAESSPLSNAEPASAPTKAEPQETPEEIAARKAEELRLHNLAVDKVVKGEQLSHPTAPNVTAEEPTGKPVEMAPETTTKLVPYTIEWPDGQTSTRIREVVEFDKSEPEWYLGVFTNSKNFAVETADLDAVTNHYQDLEEAMKKIRCAQFGVRAGLEMRLSGETAEKRTKALANLNRSNRSGNNAAATRMKTERAPKAPKKGAGIELADTLGKVMALDYDEIIAKVKKAGKLDEATQEYIDKNYPKVGE
jgi:hypothetical protein